jgi:ubiquitin-conjugating enzyme E2 variant
LIGRVLWAGCLLTSASLVVLHVIRLASAPDLFLWSLPVLAVAAVFLADFVGGFVHWVADTWGSDTTLFVGRRFVRPFRVHHVNPDDLLRRDFIECNGDVAMLSIPVLLAAWWIPVTEEAGRQALAFLVAFNAAAVPTNQVHQWAHAADPPAAARWLQRMGLILSPENHARHHGAPFTDNYCITTGWCNGPLARTRLFQAFERLVTRLTGLRPRHEASLPPARSSVPPRSPLIVPSPLRDRSDFHGHRSN